MMTTKVEKVELGEKRSSLLSAPTEHVKDDDLAMMSREG